MKSTSSPVIDVDKNGGRTPMKRDSAPKAGKNRRMPGWISLLISVLFMLCLVVILINITREKPITAEKQKAEIDRITAVVEQAAILCYALEGAYPVSYEYLKENYKLMVNEEEYICILDPSEFANTPPFVFVYAVNPVDTVDPADAIDAVYPDDIVEEGAE